DAAEALLLPHRDDAVLEVRLHLVLVARVGVDHVPAEHLLTYPIRKSTKGRRTLSAAQRYAPTIPHAMITTTVPWIVCVRLGHSTLLSSAQDSRMKPPRRACVAGTGPPAASKAGSCDWARVSRGGACSPAARRAS